jgi:hypothetical protein
VGSPSCRAHQGSWKSLCPPVVRRPAVQCSRSCLRLFATSADGRKLKILSSDKEEFYQFGPGSCLASLMSCLGCCDSCPCFFWVGEHPQDFMSVPACDERFGECCICFHSRVKWFYPSLCGGVLVGIVIEVVSHFFGVNLHSCSCSIEVPFWRCRFHEGAKWLSPSLNDEAQAIYKAAVACPMAIYKVACPRHFFVVLPNAVRAACLLCTVTCLLKATGKARCWSCVGAKSLTDSGGVLPAVAAAKPLVGAPLVAFNRRVRFRAWNNGLTPDCRACLELVKLHNPLCMLKQKEFDEYEKASGRSDARYTSNRGRRSA